MHRSLCNPTPGALLTPHADKEAAADLSTQDAVAAWQVAGYLQVEALLAYLQSAKFLQQRLRSAAAVDEMLE